MNEYIQLIKSLGLSVYVKDENATWCHFTDGVNIGYAQWGRNSTSVSTVHKANCTTGTGFRYADDITESSIMGSLKCIAPNWASAGDAKTVIKYRDFADFAARNWYPVVQV